MGLVAVIENFSKGRPSCCQAVGREYERMACPLVRRAALPVGLGFGCKVERVTGKIGSEKLLTLARRLAYFPPDTGSRSQTRVPEWTGDQPLGRS